MPAQTRIKTFLDTSVAANSTDIFLSPIIPNGRVVTLTLFGAADPGNNDGLDGLVAIQFGDNGGGWTSIRAAVKMWEFNIHETFAGDGVKRFRIIRQNRSVLAARQIYAWAEAIIHDVD